MRSDEFQDTSRMKKAAQLAEQLDTPLFRFFGGLANWIAIAVVAWGVWSGKAWLKDFVPTIPMVAEAHQKAVDAELKARAVEQGQFSIQTIVARQESERAETRQAFIEISTKLAVVGAKVDSATSQRSEDMKRIDDRLNQIQTSRQ